MLRWCTEREVYVLQRRHGIIGDPATLDVIGTELGVTRERVRQIEKSAVGKAAAGVHPS